MKKSITHKDYGKLTLIEEEAVMIMNRMNELDELAFSIFKIPEKKQYKDEGSWCMEWMWSDREDFTLRDFLEKYKIVVKDK